MAFDVSYQIDDGIAKITLSGELDATTANTFKGTVEKVAGQHPKRIVLLMEGLTFMASAGLRVLIFAKQKMDTGVDIFVVGAQEVVRGTIEKTGFHHSVIMLAEYDATQIETL